ncbi:MAG: hypothetical protein Q4E95_11670 [Kocuria sp.]|nr:hypothetical protein [Kocuria sp.]
MALAHRMLAGAGRAALVAYGLEGQPTLDALAHGMTGSGDLMVATTVFSGSDDAVLLNPGTSMDVRMDITKLSPEPRVEILTASAHMLGQLEWLDTERASDVLEYEDVPEMVKAVAKSPFGMLGIVRVSRVLLHDGVGATAISFAHLVERNDDVALAGLGDIETVGLDVASSLDSVDLASLCDAVSNGWVEARVLSEKPSVGGCSHTKNREFVVDVDVTGLTVMRNGAERTRVFFVPFDRESVVECGGLFARVESLLGTRVGAPE